LSHLVKTAKVADLFLDDDVMSRTSILHGCTQLAGRPFRGGSSFAPLRSWSRIAAGACRPARRGDDQTTALERHPLRAGPAALRFLAGAQLRGVREPETGKSLVRRASVASASPLANCWAEATPHGETRKDKEDVTASAEIICPDGKCHGHTAVFSHTTEPKAAWQDNAS
jgi:hypothetical protein